MKEFEFIDHIESLIKIKSEDIICGIGDDCAVISRSAEKAEIITTDSMVEGIHFLREYISPLELGQKAAATNLSDIAAMGGDPKFALVSLAIPQTCDDFFLKELYMGIIEELTKYETTIVGGNTSSSLRDLSINITLIGEVNKKEIVFRCGAKPGDSIYVTGTLGDSAAGLEILKHSLSIPHEARLFLIKRHILPTPRIKEAKQISKNLRPTAMIDISDGLSSDLLKICEKSGVGAVILEESIPFSYALTEYAKGKNKTSVSYALNGGEDYELLFTISPEFEEILSKIWNKDFSPLSKIGTIVEEKEICLIGRDMKKNPLKADGYIHNLG